MKRVLVFLASALMAGSAMVAITGRDGHGLSLQAHLAATPAVSPAAAPPEDASRRRVVAPPAVTPATAPQASPVSTPSPNAVPAATSVPSLAPQPTGQPVLSPIPNPGGCGRCGGSTAGPRYMVACPQAPGVAVYCADDGGTQ